MLAEIFHATLGVCLLSAVVSGIYLGFTDLPVQPFLFGAALGMPTGIALLVITSPRRRHWR
jgi:hypothetical protein